MSRTKHHKNQRGNKAGVDFGARYNCDKNYIIGTGPYAKDLADSERRNDSKRIIREELEQKK